MALVWLVLNNIISSTCLQHRFPSLGLHGLHHPGLFCTAFLTTLLFFIILLPIKSLRFLLRLNTTIGGSLKLNLAFNFMMFQLFLSISDILGNVLLYVITHGMRLFAFLGGDFSVSSCRVLLTFLSL